MSTEYFERSGSDQVRSETPMISSPFGLRKKGSLTGIIAHEGSDGFSLKKTRTKLITEYRVRGIKIGPAEVVIEGSEKEITRSKSSNWGKTKMVSPGGTGKKVREVSDIRIRAKGGALMGEGEVAPARNETPGCEDEYNAEKARLHLVPFVVGV